LISPLTLVLTAAAAGIWYLRPEVGWWPLLPALAPWALRLAVQRRPAYPTPFDWGLGLFLLTAALSVWAAYDQATALAKFWPIVAGVLLFYAFSNWQFDDRRAAGLLGWMLALFGAVVTAYYLAVNDWVAFPARAALLTQLGTGLQGLLPGALTGGEWHRLHPNVVGGILAMMAPFAGMVIWRSWRERKGWPLAAATTLLVVILFGLLMSSSRGAWLGIVGAVGLALWWQLLDRLARGRQTRRRRLFAGSLAGGLAALVIALWIRPDVGASVLASMSGVSGLGRMELVQAGLALIQDYPLIGGGLDLFKMLHASYALLLHVGFAVHSHNLYLDVAIEQGLPGLFALLWLGGMFGMVLWQAARLQKWSDRAAEEPPAGEGSAGEPGAGMAPADGGPSPGSGAVDEVSAGGGNGLTTRRRRRYRRRKRSIAQTGVLAAASVSLLTVALHGLVDDAFYGSRAVMLLFIPLAFTATRLARWREAAQTEKGAFERAKFRSLRRANLIAGGGLALTLLLAALVPGWRSYWWSNLAAIEQSRTELSAYSWPEWPIQDQLRRDLDLVAPVVAYERALALNPSNVGANRRLGMIALSVGAYEQALGLLERAYGRAEWDNTTRQLLGEALIANGRVADGAALWRTVDNGQGQLELRRFWYEHIGDGQRLAWVEEALQDILRR